jgi:uncharacterized membrane protein YphA (DoxX/SURF4 family)
MTAVTRLLPTATRSLLGLVFFVLGLNGFFGFLPQPPVPEAAQGFMGALAATGYLLPLLKGVEVIAGVLLLSGRFVPLALALLAPIVVNIVAFHLFLAPGGLGIALFVLAAELYLALHERAAFRPLFSTEGQPERAALRAPLVDARA